MQYLLQLVHNGIAVGILYCVVARCFMGIQKTRQKLQMPEAESILVATWVCWWLRTACQLPFIESFLLTLAFMLMFGGLLEAVVRPLLREASVAAVTTAIGMSIVLQTGMRWMLAQPSPNMFLGSSLPLLGIRVPTVYLAGPGTALLMITGMIYLVALARLGRPDNQSEAGVSANHLIELGWTVSSVISVLSGVVVGPALPGVSPIGISAFPASIPRGLTSLPGAVLGGLIIGLLETLSRTADAQWLGFGSLSEMGPFYVLIVILTVRSAGPFGCPAETSGVLGLMARSGASGQPGRTGYKTCAMPGNRRKGGTNDTREDAGACRALDCCLEPA